MKLKLIDEDWIDNRIEQMVTYMGQSPNNDNNIREAKVIIQVFEYVKSKLQSPVEEIRKAFEASQKVEYEDISFDGGDTYETVAIIQDVNKYLKEKGYE